MSKNKVELEKHLRPEIFERFQTLLIKISGLHFVEDRKNVLEQKVLERMESRGISSFENYYNFLTLSDKMEEERKALIDLLTIGETYFFRNLPHFDVLKTFVLPQWIHSDREKAIKMWCAGSSTGEEPYSLAILLAETLPNYKDWKIDFLATDINRDVLALAAEGLYSKRSVGEVPMDLLLRYFTVDGARYRLSEEIKKMVTFKRHNLITELLPFEETQDLDILFCRNVTIYFNLETLKQLMRRFAQCLKPGGYLFLGHAETLWNISDEFIPLEFPHTFIYQKKSQGKEVFESVALPPEISIPEIVETQVESKSTTSSFSSQEYLDKATAYADNEAFQDSVQCLNRILEHDNLYAPAYHLLGILKVKLGAFAEAEAHFKKLLYVDPDLVVGYFHLGNLYCRLGKNDLARKEYQQGIKKLEKMDENALVPLSDNMTVNLMRRAIQQGLEFISKEGKRL